MKPPAKNTQQTVVVQRQSTGGRFVALLAFFAVTFIVFGFLFTAGSTREWVSAVWAIALAVIAFIATAAALIYAIIAIYDRWQEARTIYPDENGNLPVRLGRKGKHENLNLAGLSNANQDKGWLTWQLTSNPHTGSLPAASIQQHFVSAQPAIGLIEGPGGSIVIDAVAEELRN